MGAIRVSPNGRYFVDENGQPSFWLGDTQWQLFRDFTVEDAAAVLQRRMAQGFSAIQIMITGEGDGTRPNLEGEAPWVGDDPARPNEAYFRNADRVVEAARPTGLVLVLGVYHKTQREQIPVEKARRYARWISERYRDAPHVIWAMYPEAKGEYVPVLRELAAGLEEGDAGAHLITVHPDPSPASSSFIHEEEWLDFNMIQTWHDLPLNVPMVRDDYARSPVKPTVMAEGGYEAAEHTRLWTPLDVRRQAWWSYLCGGHHSYGHHGNWTSPGTWREWIDSPGAQHMGVCRHILTSLPAWWDLVPDQVLFVSGAGEGAEQNVAARSASDDWALLYLSGTATVAIDTSRVCGGSASRASWVDPTTGERTEIGPIGSAKGPAFTTPTAWEDALLLFESAEPA